MTSLPPVDPGLAAEVVEALPRRLRARLDDAVAQAGGWTVEPGPPVLVRMPGATVTLTIDAGGQVGADGAACDCLLAPRCLHLAAVLSAAPVADAGPASVTGSAAPAAAEPVSDAAPLSAGAARAVGLAWSALTGLVGAGAGNATAADRADLLRAVHLARAESLHLLAATVTRVAESLRLLRSGDPAFSRDALAAATAQALAAASRLRTDEPVGPELRGRARRDYRPAGSLDLSGVLCEPVLTATGYAGVATLLLDGGGRRWSLGSVTPGQAELIGRAYGGATGFGAASVSHRRLARGGLLVGGATASADGRLGSPASAQAVARPGLRWDQAPLVVLWARPLVDQVAAALAARDGPARTAGDDLLFADVRVAGGRADDLLLVTADGVTLAAGASPAAVAMGGLDDLRLLAAHPGLPLRVVARVGGTGARAVVLLAFGPPPDQGDQPGPALRLPDTWLGRAFLGLDRLTGALITSGDAGQGALTAVPSLEPLGTEGPTPHERLAAWLGRVAVHGRGVLVGGKASLATDAARLRRAGAPHGADLLDALAGAASAGTRRFDGTLAPQPEPLATAWLHLAIYTEAARRHITTAAWTPAPAP